MTQTIQRKPLNAPAKRLRYMRALSIFAAITVLIAAFAGWRWWQYASVRERTTDAYVDGQVVQITSKIPGTVLRVPVTHNQTVKEGQILIELDASDYKLDLSAQQAALARAVQQAQAARVAVDQMASMSRAVARTRSALPKPHYALSANTATTAKPSSTPLPLPPQVKAYFEGLDKKIETAQAQVSRFEQLYDRGLISKEELGQMYASLESLKAERETAKKQLQQRLQAAQQIQRAPAVAPAPMTAMGQAPRAVVPSLEAIRQQMRVAQENVRLAETAVRQAQVAVDQSEKRLQYTQIKAPVTGRIGVQMPAVGASVQPGAPLLTLVSGEPWITANFRQPQLGRLREGQPVEIRIDSMPGKVFLGRLESIAPASIDRILSSIQMPPQAVAKQLRLAAKSGGQPQTGVPMGPVQGPPDETVRTEPSIPAKIVFDKQSIAGFESRIIPGMHCAIDVIVGR